MPSGPQGTEKQKCGKPSYNKRNWSAYDQSLKNRGSLTIWFSEDAVEQWNVTPSAYVPRKRGRPKVYSDLAIQTCQTLRMLFKQPLRQTEGLVSSIIMMLNLDLKTPDHTTFSRRLEHIIIPQGVSAKNGAVLIVDSTGLKTMGAQEWQNYKHGTKQVKVWKKLNIAIEDGIIVSHTLTTHTISDTSQVEPLLSQIDTSIAELIGDGGYDHNPTYGAITQQNQQHGGQTTIIIPPNVGFQRIRDTDPPARKINQQIIEEYGRDTWEEITNYGRRSSVEGTFARWKCIVGGTLRSKNDSNQAKEAAIGVLILNKTLQMNPGKARKAA